MNIIHAGGKIEDKTYTNSKESIIFNIKNNPNVIFELDVVEILNGIKVIAHDGTEKYMYNLDKKFNEITLEEYMKLKVYGKFTPMTFDDLFTISNANPLIKFVLDIKENDEKYEKTIIFIKEKYNLLLPKLIFQAYNLKDVDCLVKHNIKSCLIALWKFWRDPLGDITKSFIAEAKRRPIGIFGLSIHYIFTTKHNYPQFNEFCKKLSINIYYHGQGEQITIQDEKKVTEKFGGHFFTTKIY